MPDIILGLRDIEQESQQWLGFSPCCNLGGACFELRWALPLASCGDPADACREEPRPPSIALMSFSSAQPYISSKVKLLEGRCMSFLCYLLWFFLTVHQYSSHNRRELSKSLYRIRAFLLHFLQLWFLVLQVSNHLLSHSEYLLNAFLML